MNNYLLVIYQPSSEEWQGCSCHGHFLFHDSDLFIKRFCNETDLIIELDQLNNQLKENEESISSYKVSIFRNNEPIYQDNNLRLFLSEENYYLSWSDDYPECSSEYPVEEVEKIITAMQSLLKNK